MATITKRRAAFRITVSLGYDEHYKQIRETAATVSAQLGHGSIDTTVYVHSFKAAQAAAAAGLQTLLRKQ